MKIVDILGTKYTIKQYAEKDHPLLNGMNRDGCIDVSTKEIVLREKTPDCDLQDYETYQKSVLRHEIIHAFLYESGLDSSSFGFSGAWATNEEMVDWIAIQFPKMLKVFDEVGCL